MIEHLNAGAGGTMPAFGRCVMAGGLSSCATTAKAHTWHLGGAAHATKDGLDEAGHACGIRENDPPCLSLRS